MTPFRTPLNCRNWPKKNQYFTEVSQTIPEQSMSIKEAIARFTMGLPVGGARVPIYEGDDDIYPDLNTMDLVERDEYVQESLEKLNRYKKQQADKLAAERAAYDKKIADEIRKQASQRSAALPPEVTP